MINSGQGGKERTHPIKLQTSLSAPQWTPVDAWAGVINSVQMADKQLTYTWEIISGYWLYVDDATVSNEDACLKAHHCGHMG